MRTKAGTTLLELVMVLALMIITISIPVTLFITARNYLLESDALTTLQFDSRLAIQRISNELRQSSIGEISIDPDDPVIGIDAIRYEILNDADGNGIPDIDAQGDPDWANATEYSMKLNTSTHSLLKLDLSGNRVAELARNVKKINFYTRDLDSTLAANELKVSIEYELTDSRGTIRNKTLVSIINIRN